MLKRSWKSLVGLMIVVVAVTGLVCASIAMADDSDESTDTPQPGERCEMFKGKVADNLGVTTDDLDTAVTNARNQMIDEAVANGKLTQEQADEIKQRTEENGACPLWLHRPHWGIGGDGNWPGIGERWQMGEDGNWPGIGERWRMGEDGNWPDIGERWPFGEYWSIMGLNKLVGDEIITQEQADQIETIMEDVKAYCEENGCVRDGGNLLDKAVENGVITQVQANEIKAILEQVKGQIGENGGMRGFPGRGSCGENAPTGMGSGGFMQRGFGGHGMMGTGETA